MRAKEPEEQTRDGQRRNIQVYLEEGHLVIDTKSTSARIPVREIIMVQHANRKVLVYRIGKAEPVVYTGKLKETIRMLGAPFYLCTNTLGINLAQVETMHQGEVTFFDGVRVFIGRDNFVRARKAYSAYLKEHGRRSPEFEEKCRKLREK